MSAFVVGKEHINAMVTAGLARAGHDGAMRWFHDDKWHELNEVTADAVGQMLLDENVKSVMTRYEDCEITDLPGKIDAEWIIPFIYTTDYEVPTGVETLKIIRCYIYQSCEHEEWRGSEASEFCQSLTIRQFRRLKGWEDAPWEWTKPVNPNIMRVI